MNYSILSPKKKEKEQSKPDTYGVITPEWSFDEIVLAPTLVDTIEDIIAYCKNKDKIIHEWKLKRFLKGKGGTTAINFFGVPGTGKSIAAEALSKAIGKNLIKADYSEITDSLYGGTEKKLTGLFEKAERNNAMIFFDEADGLLSERSSETKASENSNQIKSHLLTLLDRSDVIIVFSTNLFENYDKAFFRRILFHCEFELPDFNQRIDLWKFHLDTSVPKSVDYSVFAEKSANLSGGDIKNLVLKLCIKLSARKIQTIDADALDMEISKYKKALEASKKKETFKIVDAPPSIGSGSNNIK